MLDIYIINIEKGIKSDNIKHLFSVLDKSEIIRLNKMKNDSDKEKFLLSKYILKRIISKYINKDASVIKFEYNQFGKPYIQNNLIHFNLSHSDNFLMIGVSESKLGVDIENLKSIDLNIAKSFCTNRELRYFNGCTDKYDIFFKLWTLKESFIKNIGQGLYFNVKKIDFDLNNYPQIQSRINNHILESKKFFTQKIKDNIFSICYSKKSKEPNIINFIDVRQFTQAVKINPSPCQEHRVSGSTTWKTTTVRPQGIHFVNNKIINKTTDWSRWFWT